MGVRGMAAFAASIAAKLRVVTLNLITPLHGGTGNNSRLEQQAAGSTA